jgi:hypothetical protein
MDPENGEPTELGLGQAGTASPAQADHGHSKAFENLVSGPDDLVGLLAYAKFKQGIHEAAIAGNHMDKAARNLTPAMVEVFRSAAEQMITQVVNDGLQAAAPDIEKSALRTAMDAHFAEAATAAKEEQSAITKHIDRRTSFLSAFLINVAAWVVTLLIAVLIIFLWGRPSPEEAILGSGKPAAQVSKEERLTPQQPAVANDTSSQPERRKQ